MSRTLFVLVVVSVVLTGGVAADTAIATGLPQHSPVATDGVAGHSTSGPTATDTVGQTVHETTVDCSYPVSVRDATGETVTVTEEPDTVVVLGPSSAQHVWEIGAQEKVVGMPVNEFTAYLNGSEERTDVVDESGQPNAERVVDLDPDLVLAPNIVDNETVERLRGTGLTVYRSPLATSVEDVYAEVERVGLLVGEFESAAAVTAETEGTVQAVETALADEQPVRVYYDLGFPFTVGPNTLEDDIITRAGGDNVARTANESGYFQISQEVLVTEDPEWIVVNENRGVPDVAGLENTTAVREDQIVEVDPNYISQHGPRNTVPLVHLAESFHPGAMADADIENATGPDPATCGAGGDNTPGSETDEEADSLGPGLGVATALVALGTLVLAGRYRRR